MKKLFTITWLVLFCPLPLALGAIRIAGSDYELSLSAAGPRTVRLSLAPLDSQGNPRPPSPSTVLEPIQIVQPRIMRDLPAETTIDVGELRVNLKSSPLTISVRRASGALVQELAIDPTDGSITFHTDAPVFGLGEGQQQFDRRGTRYNMVNGQTAPFLATHGATIPVPFLIGADGWAMFLHSPWGQFDLREGHGKFTPQAQGLRTEPFQIFVMALDDPADALADFVRLTGHPVMPPKWLMGYIQSHRTLADTKEPLQIAQTFREKKLPCDALIYLGTGYCPAGWNTGHGSLEFNPKTFDHPADTINALHDLGFKIVLHVNHAPRNLFGNSIAEKSDSPIHISNYWATHRADFALGVDAWWPDDGDELPIESRLARIRCYYEGPLQDRPNQRPWSLDRNGYAGMSRYGGWIWSGDVQSRWATLAAHVPVGINASLSVTPFWGTDIGGFVPTRELTGELYARWFQFATFNPLFRSHGRTWHLRLPWGWNTGDPGPIESRPDPDPNELHNAQIEPICKKYLELRYQLLPYNYTLVREACDTGLPPMRAMWLHYPKDAEATKLGDQYLWGRDLLIAPVVERDAKTRRVYLPTGTWYDWWTGEKLAGGRWIDRPVDLAIMPIYARAGAIIPLDPVRQFTGQQVNEPTTLSIYPGADGSFTLYNDDGNSMGYQTSSDAKTTWITARWDDAIKKLTIEPDARMKPWPGGTRTFAVRIAGSAATKRIDFRGERVETKM
ncbi:MAG TPA: TIM-barrel domain-containing protein [Humisphaera sp.]|nr:TIM-barrel domain-containing protein [Humisphaera sp.]